MELAQPRRADPPVVSLDIEKVLALASQCAEESDDGLAAEIDALQAMVKTVWRSMPEPQRATIYQAVFEPVLTDDEMAVLDSYSRSDHETDIMIGEALGDAVEGTGGDWTPPTSDVIGEGFLQWILKVARDHGEDEPDHEVGDLQGVLSVLWLGLDEAQKWDVIRTSDVWSAVAMLGRLDEFATPDSVADIDAEDWAAAIEAFGLDPSFQYSDAQQAEIFNAWLVDQALPADFDSEQPTYRTPLDERPRVAD